MAGGSVLHLFQEQHARSCLALVNQPRQGYRQVHIAAYASYSEAASPDRELREGGSGDGVGMIDYEAARRREQR